MKRKFKNCYDENYKLKQFWNILTIDTKNLKIDPLTHTALQNFHRPPTPVVQNFV